MSTSIIGKNAFANVVGMVGQIIIAFLISPFLVHTLGDTQYGIWTIAVAFTGYMNLLDLGLTSAVNRFVAKYRGLRDPKNINSIISTSLALFLVMGLVIVAVSPFMANLVVSLVNFDEELTDVVHLLIIILSFDIAIFVISGLFKAIFGGFQKFLIINYVQIVSAVYKAIMFYLFLSEGHGLIAMGIISISANVIVIVIFYLVLVRTEPDVAFMPKLISKQFASKILHYSKFTFIAMVANQVIFYSDAFVIGYFLNAAAVTYYSIPWALADYAKKISLAISRTYIPAISEASALGDLKKIQLLYMSGTRYMLIVSNLLSIGIMCLGGAFISVWMGPEYRELGESVLIVLIVSQVVLGPQLISYAILQGLAKQRNYSYMSIAVSVINLGLSIILVRIWGIVGVAVGAAIPQILFHGVYVPMLTLKVLGLSASEYFRETYAKSILPSIGLFAVLISWREFDYPNGYFEILLIAIVSACLYLALGFIFMLSNSERDAIKRFAARKLTT